MENKVVQCVKIKEKQLVLVGYTEFGLTPLIWFSEHTKLWLNPYARSFRQENRCVDCIINSIHLHSFCIIMVVIIYMICTFFISFIMHIVLLSTGN